MALIKTGGGVTDLRGGFGGVYFTRDNSGLHCTAKPRRVKQRTPDQDKQRKAFSIARAYSKINRIVSYNIYRALTGLHVGLFYDVTGEITPDTTGHYIEEGRLNSKPYYTREDGAWFIWYDSTRYIISIKLDAKIGAYWRGLKFAGVAGIYGPLGDASGTATVAQHSTDPPLDYQPPGL